MAIFGGYREEDLLQLDDGIRDWVVLPMVIIVVLVGIGRHYAQQLMKSTPRFDNESHLTEVRNKQVLSQAMRLRVNGNALPSASYYYRKAYLVRKKTGLLREKTPPPVNPMSNPMAMMDMMKGNLSFMLPNIAMMGLVSNFFSGFVCLKIPFPLPSIRFKMMMQRGVDLSTLDVSYVSSLSWYFLLTFGMNGVYKLILGSDAELDDIQKQMSMGMPMGGGAGQVGFDAGAAYRAEREALSIAPHQWLGDSVERTLLAERYPDSSYGQSVDLSGLN